MTLPVERQMMLWLGQLCTVAVAGRGQPAAAVAAAAKETLGYRAGGSEVQGRRLLGVKRHTAAEVGRNRRPRDLHRSHCLSRKSFAKPKSK
jgi:hypothetical protein